MDLKTRAQNIIVTPKTEWPVIAGEMTPTGTLITSYVMPLAAIGAIAGFIGGSIIGFTVPFAGTFRVPFMTGLGTAIFAFIMAIVGVYVLGFIINALAPRFGGQQSSEQAMKVAIYSYTPAWIAGALQILPMLGILAALAGLYGLYLLYLGLPPLMKNPQDRSIGYTAVVLICAIVLAVAVSLLSGLILGPMAAVGLGSGAFGSSTPAAESQIDPDSPLGKLEALGRSLEQSGAKMDAAQKSGDTAAQTAAAFEGLGTLLGGGKRVEPVSIDQLRPLVPETFAGLPKRSSNVERTGMAGIMVATAEASYGDGNTSVSLDITDTGGASGLVGLASWINIQGERDNDQVSERTEHIGGRMVHQRVSKTGGNNEYTVVIGERFIVKAEGRSDIASLKNAVFGLDLGRLEQLTNSK